ncbi:hypothetical protein IPL68_00390 [Candidatus Saccharibacteria bacterium]|nr:MAG: hypothetical protein IPL68_00390 [Candidatus Saccharibacteria bacterium]
MSSLRVDIYSGKEHLDATAKEAIISGLAEFGSVARLDLLLRHIPGCGKLDQRKIVVDKLPLEELLGGKLNILVGNFALHNNLAGSYFGEGFVFLNPTTLASKSLAVVSRPATALRIATAHETAHALGFVTPERSQTAHCRSEGCIMQSSLGSLSLKPDSGYSDVWSGVVPIHDGRRAIVPDNATFCEPCVNEISEHTEQHIQAL